MLGKAEQSGAAGLQPGTQAVGPPIMAGAHWRASEHMAVLVQDVTQAPVRHVRPAGQPVSHGPYSRPLVPVSGTGPVSGRGPESTGAVA